MLVWTIRFLLLAGVLLVGWGSWRMLEPEPPAPDPPLTVEWPAADLGELGPGVHEVVVYVSNSSSRSRRILGMLQGCRENVCFGPKIQEPIAIPPGGRAALICELDVTGVGPFECPIVLFLEENGIRDVQQQVRGIGIATENKANAKPAY